MIWLVLVAGSVGAGWLLGQGDAAENARAAMASAPADLLGVMLGLTLGLYGRDLVRLRRTYASPSLAFMGKSLFFASFAAAASWILSPIAWPATCVHVFAAGGAAGMALWLGNLPSKL